MNSLRYTLAALLLAVLGIVVNACGSGTVSAGSTLTQAEFDSFLLTSSAFTALKAQVAAIGSPAVYIKGTAIAASTSDRMPQSISGCVTVSTLGTLTGRPNTSNPISDDDESGVSSTGYYFTISGAPTASDCGRLQTIPAAVTVYFSDPLCHDVEGVNGMSAQALAQGFVFHMDLDGTDPTYADAGHYWYLAAGTSPVSMSYQSLTASSGRTVTCLATYNNGAGSSANNSGTITAYPVLNNNSTITGIPSAPIQGPLTVTK